VVESVRGSRIAKLREESLADFTPGSSRLRVGVVLIEPLVKDSLVMLRDSDLFGFRGDSVP
jgi:hypothetical protein